jgi:hypothetical protein
MSFTTYHAALCSLKQRCFSQLSLAVGAAFLLLVAPLVCAQGNVPSPSDRCPFEDALDFQVVQALKVMGVTDQQFEDLAAAGEIKKYFSDVCMDELNQATANPDTNCQIVNGKAVSRLSSYMAVAGYHSIH